VEVVLAVDVQLPRDVLYIELGLREAADEAAPLNLGLLLRNQRPLVGEGIDDDSEEDVEQNDVDYQEERKVEEVSRPEGRSTPSGLA